MEQPSLDFMKENALGHQRFLGIAIAIVLAQDIAFFMFLYPDHTYGLMVISVSMWMLLFGLYCVFRCSHADFFFIFNLEDLYYLFNQEEAFRSLTLAEYANPDMSDEDKDRIFEQHRLAIEQNVRTKIDEIRNELLGWQTRAEQFLISGAIILYGYVTYLAGWENLIALIVGADS